MRAAHSHSSQDGRASRSSRGNFPSEHSPSGCGNVLIQHPGSSQLSSQQRPGQSHPHPTHTWSYCTGYQKIKNFMLISKKQNCLSDTMPPQKVKIKKRKRGLGKIGKRFFLINIKFSIFVNLYDLFQEKNFTPQKGCFQNFQHKNRKKYRNATKLRKIPFLK